MTVATLQQRWTPTEDRILREKYPTTRVVELCHVLGRSHRSVLGRVNRLGLKRVTQHKWSAADLSYVLEQRDCMTYAEIAGVLGVSLRALLRMTERYGIYRYHRGLTEHEQRRFKNLHTRGYSDLKIARKLRLTKSRVRRHRHRIGLQGNGRTKHSWTNVDPSILRSEERREAAKKFGKRKVALNELVELAMQFTSDDEEMLTVVWEAMREVWTDKSMMSDMALAAQDGIAKYRRETYTHLSIDGFTDDDGNKFDVSEDKRRLVG